MTEARESNISGDLDDGLVTLYYQGSQYWARDVRYWVKSRNDGFVYDSYDDLEEARGRPMNPEMVGIWDRQEGRWV